FYTDHQAHGDALGFVMVSLMEKIYGAEAGAKTESRTCGFAADSTCDKWTHDGVSFTVSMIETALRGKGVGGDQAGENPGVDFGFERPKAMLAGRIGNW